MVLYNPTIIYIYIYILSQVVKNPPANVGDIRAVGSIPGSGRSPGEDHGNPLQYSCLENSMDRGAWWPTVHGVAKSWTQLSDFTIGFYTNSESFTSYFPI